MCSLLRERAIQSMVDDYHEAMRTRINPWTGQRLGDWFDYYYGDENGI